jgi:hypothetical protein
MTNVGVQRWITGAGAVLLAVTFASPADAQHAIEPPAVNPGARSLGLGGAFVAVADDATAAWVNPSGLLQLLRPEISAEGRSWSEDREGVASNESSLGFLSFVLPRSSWAVAFYGQTLSSLDFAEAWTGGDPVDPISGLVMANAGVSAALPLGEKLSVGFGLTAFVGTVTEVFDNDPSSYPFFEDSVESSIGLTGGVLWSIDSHWAVGASVRSGADFSFPTGSRAVFPDIVAAGARWRSAGGNAILTAEIEHLSGLGNRLRPHLGGEWVFLRVKPLIGLRAGIWHDPSGGAVARTPDGGTTDAEAVFHVAGGIGFAWRKFQLDLAFDDSERTTIASISGIFTF